MTRQRHEAASIEREGWRLISAEDTHAANPETFVIPSLEARSALKAGDAAKLLFDIETREQGQVIDRGVDRMWVIVRARLGDRYVGVLDSDPGKADGLQLRPSDEVVFGPEHIASIDRPPRDFVLKKHGADFFAP